MIIIINVKKTPIKKYDFCSDSQGEFIDIILKIIDEHNNNNNCYLPFEFNPPSIIGNENSPNNFYKKKVYVFIPHLQLGGLVVKCPACNIKLCNKGFCTQVARKVHDVSSMAYLIQYRYNCTNHNCQGIDILSDETNLKANTK